MKTQIQKEQNRANRKRFINQDILKISVFFAVLFFALILFLGYFLYFRSDDILNNTYNKRTGSMARTVQRGSIISSDGEVLAYTETDEEGTEKRIYPYGSVFAHTVGYPGHGGMGIESIYNYSLMSTHADTLEKLSNEFTETKNPGDNVITTLDAHLQLRADEILGGCEGAIVVLDPASGAILAMVSNPGFDPNEIDSIWNDITSDDESSVLLNRATQATLTPGSTFKIFTLLEFYRQQKSYIYDYNYLCEGSITVDDNTVNCVGGTWHGYEDIFESFAYSCNSSFANIGLQLNLAAFAAHNRDMLFNSPLPVELPYKESSFKLDQGASTFMVMQTSFGQGETLISPIHLALVTSAVANGGVLMKPQLISRIEDAGGHTVKEYLPESYARLLSSDEVEFMRQAMRDVAVYGTGSILGADGNYTAYGKTGTAETSSYSENNYDHSWFTGFAENNGQTIVVCAMIENTQEAGITGVYAAKQIFNYYFN